MSYAIREPVLHPTPILKLRPTQMTVGLREVALKRKDWAARGGKKADGFLARHLAPVVIGPGERSFLVDHHHLVRALHDEGLESVFVVIVADLRKLDLAIFWNVMEFHGWAHPYDAEGKRRDFADLPKTVEDLVDDPYRSLAGELRSAGGFAKDTTPFSEFLWADFLRPRIRAKELRKDFDVALERATALAKTEDASYLPGWCAPHAKLTPAAKKTAAAKGASGKDAAAKSGKHKDEAKLRRGAAPPAAD